MIESHVTWCVAGTSVHIETVSVYCHFTVEQYVRFYRLRFRYWTNYFTTKNIYTVSLLNHATELRLRVLVPSCDSSRNRPHHMIITRAILGRSKSPCNRPPNRPHVMIVLWNPRGLVPSIPKGLPFTETSLVSFSIDSSIQLRTQLIHSCLPLPRLTFKKLYSSDDLMNTWGWRLLTRNQCSDQFDPYCIEDLHPGPTLPGRGAPPWQDAYIKVMPMSAAQRIIISSLSFHSLSLNIDFVFPNRCHNAFLSLLC